LLGKRSELGDFLTHFGGWQICRWALDERLPTIAQSSGASNRLRRMPAHPDGNAARLQRSRFAADVRELMELSLE
jgi:hypothetical protein